MSALLRAWSHILRFYFRQLTSFGRIHPDLPSGKLLDRLCQEDSELSLDAAFAQDFNAEYAALKAELKGSFQDPDFGRILAGCWAVRVAECVAIAACGPWGLLCGLGQFVVAPLSLTGSLIRLLTNFSDCLVHYTLNALVALACAPLIAACPWLPKISVGPLFIAAFFLIDFALNMAVYFHTSESLGFPRLMKHIVYGSFNTKTYFVAVLGCLYGLEFDLLVVVLTGGLTKFMIDFKWVQWLLRAVGWPCFEVCFYVEHRLGHVPVVYQHAHKMHHYLHDTTPFDAHVYGSGMNEEFFWILAEVLPVLLAPHTLFPYFLNWVTLYISWTNKGAHARSAEGVGADTLGCFDQDNFHADHHTLHRANFGASTCVVLDFYFGTQGLGTKGSMGFAYTLRPDPDDASRVLLKIARATGNNRGPWLPAPVAEEEEEDEPAGATDGAVPGAATGAKWESRIVSLREVEAMRSLEAGGVWVALHGGVFDLTAFLRIHPGGSVVLLAHAGTDATATFDEIGHSAKAKEMSLKRLIGVLEGQEPSGLVAEFLKLRRANRQNGGGAHTNGNANGNGAHANGNGTHPNGGLVYTSAAGARPGGAAGSNGSGGGTNGAGSHPNGAGGPTTGAGGPTRAGAATNGAAFARAGLAEPLLAGGRP